MAASCSSRFETKALINAEDELLKDGLQKASVKDALKELKSLLKTVSKRYFGGKREDEYIHVVGPYFPILKRWSVAWEKVLNRRMLPKCCVSHPWQVVFETTLPEELFEIIKTIVCRTNYGVTLGQSKRKYIMSFSSRTRVRKLFCELTQKEIQEDCFLKRSMKNLERVEAIINEEKQFCITYDRQKELLLIDMFYGYWNHHGWPQHTRKTI